MKVKCNRCLEIMDRKLWDEHFCEVDEIVG
jgi:hypothetical protein